MLNYNVEDLKGGEAQGVNILNVIKYTWDFCVKNANKLHIMKGVAVEKGHGSSSRRALFV